MPESSEKERYIALDRRGAARQHRGEEQRPGKPPECPESGKNGGEPCWVPPGLVHRGIILVENIVGNVGIVGVDGVHPGCRPFPGRA